MEPWVRSWQEITEDLRVSDKDGLSASEGRKRRNQYGPNRLQTTKRRSAWVILVDQLKNFIVLLLAVAAVLSLAFAISINPSLPETDADFLNDAAT